MGRNFVIKNGTVYTTRMRLAGGAVVIRDAKVVDVLGAGEQIHAPADAQVIDAAGKCVMPGFIDIHLHGGGGGDTSQADPRAIALMSEAHARFGTTAMLPTVYPGPWDTMIGEIAAIKAAMQSGVPGARVIGINMEGPFLNPSKSGALRPEGLMKPSVETLLRLVDASENNIRLISIAPELPGAIPVIKACRQRNIRTAVGHSDASYEEMVLGINAGINHVTHIFNALRRIHHRDPGVIGTVLINDEVTVELIADLYHVHPAVVVFLLKVKPNDKIALITDSLKHTGLDGDVFEADGRRVRMDEGLARLEDGTIAGSVLTMNRAIKNVVSTGLVPLEDAVKMATIVPAKVLGIQHTKGVLLPGADADIVIMDDDFDVKLTMIEGDVVHRAAGF